VSRTLPQILSPQDVDALTRALRSHRDRAMVAAMVLGGMRRCEVLGLRMEDLRVGQRRVFIAEGKGGHQRLIPVSGRFFAAVAAYLDTERPPGLRTDRVFVALKGPRRGKPLSAAGLDEILDGARRRAGLARATCHQLRHTYLTRLREAGMALEAVQAQAGHASIESTRIYLHLADDWLATQYRAAAEAIDAQILAHLPTAVSTIDAPAAASPVAVGPAAVGPAVGPAVVHPASVRRIAGGAK
jgi:site-specific recombinase XerD